MITIYLAGKIHGLSYKEATSWRNKVKEELKDCNIKFLDPMDGKDFLEDSTNIPIQTEMSNYDIFLKDIHSVEAADFILVNLNFLPVFGTAVELGYAYSLGKGILIICDNDYQNHPFVEGIGSIIFPNVNEAIDSLQKINKRSNYVPK